VFEFIQKKGETGSANFWQPVKLFNKVPKPDPPILGDNEFKHLVKMTTHKQRMPLGATR